MLIISISIVGVYSMINNAQKLAKSTDDRLLATNLAKEALESIESLRDSFELRAYDAKNCFFTIDISNLNETKCYQDGNTQYILLDNKILSATTSSNPIPVCINTYGWYSQEASKNGESCNASTSLCGINSKKECRTQFTRNIVFKRCDGVLLKECVKAEVIITWGKTSKKESLSLEQIFTRH